MPPVLEKSATEVRANFAQTLNESEYRKPQFFRRNKSSFGMISLDDLSLLMSTASVDVLVQKEEGIFLATSGVVSDIVGYGNTRSDALDAFCEDLYAYAEEYYANYELYSQSPNRRMHIPYVFRALLAQSPADVRSMLVITDA